MGENKKMVCLFVDVELARDMLHTEIELVRDLLGYEPKLDDVKAAHEKLSNVLRCLQDIEAREQRVETFLCSTRMIQLRVCTLSDKLVRYANSTDVPSVNELAEWYVELIKLTELAKQVEGTAE